MADIAISYSRSDHARVAKLAASLQREGYAVWWDQDLVAGAHFTKETEARFNSAKAVIVAWSRASIDSMWVADEAAIGRKNGSLLPITIDPVEPPIGFRQIQAVAFDAFDGPDFDSAFARLKNALAKRLATPRADEAKPDAPSLPDLRRQRIRYCRAHDGVQLAYASAGEGFPVVKTANWVSHIERDLDIAAWRHLYRGLVSENRFIRYDSRGMGLSDWTVDSLTFEDLVGDLASVVDAAGLERFALFGASQGGAIAMAYAARHPERVACLVLKNTYVRGWRLRKSETEIKREEAIISLIETGWNDENPAVRQLFTSSFAPDLSKEDMDIFNAFIRGCASAENLARNLRAVAEIDLTAEVERIEAPTLMFQVTDDGQHPEGMDEIRIMASRIPNAEAITLEGRNHFVLETDACWPRFWSETRAFLNAHARGS